MVLVSEQIKLSAQNEQIKQTKHNLSERSDLRDREDEDDEEDPKSCFKIAQSWICTS